MTVTIALSLVFTSVILLFAARRFLRKCARHDSLYGYPPGADAFTLSMLASGRRIGDPLLITVGWFLLSLVLNIGLPLLDGQARFLFDLFHVATVVNYCVLVPLLVGSYVYLLRSLRRLVPGLPSTRRSRRRFWGYQVAIMVLTLSIQYAAIKANIDNPVPCSPWVAGGNWPQSFSTACDSCRLAWKLAPDDITFSAVLYFSLRGLDTFMALSLAATIVTTWFRSGALLRGRRLADSGYPGLGPSEAARRVGTALLLCVLLANLVAAAQGVSLAIQAQELRGIATREAQIKLFVESTWPMWVVLTTIASAMAAAVILRLRSGIIGELRTQQESILARYESFEHLFGGPAKDITAVKTQIEIVDKLLDLRTKTEKRFSDAENWPLPRGVIAFATTAVLVQIANVATAAYTFVMAK